jgi:hypothetical protein
MGLQGTLIGESVRIGAVLDAVALAVTRISREEAGDTSVGQPSAWTFITFEAPADRAPDLAAALSDALEPERGWYCDFHTDDETFVVFSGRVFRYSRGDRTRRVEAEEYGRSKGVPEAQLDWPE